MLLDTDYHRQRTARRRRNPEFAEEYDRARREIAQVDAVIRGLDALRQAQGLSKADLARLVERNPSSIRRLFTQVANPELTLIAQLAEQLGAEIKVVPKRRAKPAGKRSSASRPSPAIVG